MPGRLQNKTAIITGAGSGFGAGIAKKFVEEGANVLVWDIDPSTPSKVSNELDSSGQQTLAFTGDVSNARDWDRALKEVLGKWDGLDVVVNNAGVVYSSMPSILVPEDQVDRMWQINVKPIYYSAKVIVPYWREKKRKGVVINLSSISSPRPRPNLVWYAASKGAVTAATRGLAAELTKEGIRYNCLQPVVGATAMLAHVQGGTDTEQGRAALSAGIPAGRFATPQDIGNAACFLASDEAEFLTGVCLDVDGGRSLN